MRERQIDVARGSNNVMDEEFHRSAQRDWLDWSNAERERFNAWADGERDRFRLWTDEQSRKLHRWTDDEVHRFQRWSWPEFDNMRSRFESEMRRVEEEMGRLRREFEGYTPKLTHAPPPAALPPPSEVRHYLPVSSRARYKLSRVHHSPASYASSANSPRYDPQLDAIKSPLIRDESDGKTLRLRFDVSHYAPEEVSVKTVDNRLLVHARHEEKSSQRSVYREYNQEFMLPRGTNPEAIRSSLSVDGVLTVEAPLPALPHSAPQPVPIAYGPSHAGHSPRNISHRGVY